MKNEFGKKDWTLLALALAEGAPLSPVQLQKALFLFQQRLPGNVIPRSFYAFAPYNYGPFCQQIYVDAEILAREGLATVDDSVNVRQYAATPAGRQKIDSLCSKLPSTALSKAAEIVKWVRAQSFRSLVSAIYREYPQYMANSIFKG